MLNKEYFITFIVGSMLTISGCSLNSVKPTASYVEPQEININFKSGISGNRAMELIEYDLKSATRIKEKQRYTRTKDIRVPRPDLVLGLETSKECSSETACVFSFVFHRGQFLGETKGYDSTNHRATRTSSALKITGEATTTQTITVPVKLSTSTSGILSAKVYLDGIVESKKYESLFGLTNIISGSTYSVLLKEKDIIRIFHEMAQISLPEAI